MTNTKIKRKLSATDIHVVVEQLIGNIRTGGQFDTLSDDAEANVKVYMELYKLIGIELFEAMENYKDNNSTFVQATGKHLEDAFRDDQMWINEYFSGQ